MIGSLKDGLILAGVHVQGGLHANTAAAALAREHGITSLPSIAVWPDAESHHQHPRPPKLFAIPEKTDVAQRQRLLDDLRRAAVPSVPMVTPANYASLCGPRGGGGGFGDADDSEQPRACALLFVPLGSNGFWPADSLTALNAMRAASVQDAPVRFGWVDSTRQEPFSRYLLGGANACSVSPSAAGQAARRSGSAGAEPCEKGPLPTAIVAIHTRRLTKNRVGGTLGARVSLYPSPLSGAASDGDALRAWASDITPALSNEGSGGPWRKLRGSPPPLRAVSAPSLKAHVTVWFWSWGWLLATAVIGGAVAILFFGTEIKAWADKHKKQREAQRRRQQQQQRPQQQQEQRQPESGEEQRRRRRADANEPATPDRPSESPRNGASANRSAESANGARSSASAHASGDSPRASASASVDGVGQLTASTIETVVESGSYVLIFVTNAGIAGACPSRRMPSRAHASYAP